MTITLPIPPSANRYWRTFRGQTVVSPEARAYKRAAAWEATAAGVRPLEGPVAVSVDVYRARRAGDLDNFLKVTLDALKGVAYGDDSQVTEIHARRFDDKARPRLEVTIAEAAG